MGVEDIGEVLKVVAETAGEIGMTQDDLQKCNDLLTRYGDERDRLFDQLLSLLGRSDASSIIDDWKNLCETGRNLLEPLDTEIPKSPTGEEGLKGVGAGNFAEGEKKIWDENAKNAYLALTADGLSTIYNADLELIQKCTEDLKDILDGDKSAEAIIQQNFGGMEDRMKELLATFASKAPQVLNLWLKDGSARTYTKEWSDYIGRSLEENLAAAKQKGAIKGLIVGNIKLLSDTEEQLGDSRIDEMYEKGEEFAKSLPGIGRDGDYDARDWEKFGDECTRLLAERRDRSKEQSEKVYAELLPQFSEQNARAFAALTDDPSTLATWTSEIQDDRESIEEAIGKEDEIIEALAEGPYKQALRETFEEVRLIITTSFKLLFDRTKDAEDELEE
jgi:hypothetical protein